MLWIPLLLRQKLTNETWVNLSTSTIPLFLFCFADWCPHCRKAMPSWKEFETEMENRTDIIVTSISCTEEPTVCKNLSVHGYPTFIARWSSYTFPVQVARSVTSYRSVVDRIFSLRNGTFIGNLTELPDKFPAIIFRLPPGDQAGINISLHSVATSYFMNNERLFFDFDENLTDRQLVVFIDPDFFISMDLDFTFSNIVQFIREHSYSLLGRWISSRFARFHGFLLPFLRTQAKKCRIILRFPRPRRRISHG
jgi:thiol-disulfide isomerase/thioredoxin